MSLGEKSQISLSVDLFAWAGESSKRGILPSSEGQGGDWGTILVGLEPEENEESLVGLDLTIQSEDLLSPPAFSTMLLQLPSAMALPSSSPSLELSSIVATSG